MTPPEMTLRLKKILQHEQYAQNEGRIVLNAPLGVESWFGCGGHADFLFQPADIDDLAIFLKQCPADIPVTIVGGIANCIIRDGGIRGCVIRLGKAFSNIEIQGNRILAGASALNGSVAAAAAKAGIGGLEFLSGIPGTVGGALRMNAGAYGGEVKDVLIATIALDNRGHSTAFYVSDMNMRYRYCGVPEGTIFTAAVFEGKSEDNEIVRARLKEIKAKRQETQPIAEKTGGSTFANPTKEELQKAGLAEDIKAWKLIDMIGGRSLRIGGASMSEKHCNFMLNTGNATAEDLELLGEEIINRVKEKYNLTLHWEIRRLGDRKITN